MKRCIYVGKPWGDIQYGATGRIEDIRWSAIMDAFCFIADEVNAAEITYADRYWVPRKDIYIPSEDQRRHCPKL